MTINPKNLWWSARWCTCAPHSEEPCDCPPPGWAPKMLRATLRGTGRTIVTDGFVLFYVAELINPQQIPTPVEMPEEHMLRACSMLVRSPIYGVPDLWFAKAYLDPIEAAGYKVRELDGEDWAHAIVAEEHRVVGAIMPVRIGTHDLPNPATMRKPAR